MSHNDQHVESTVTPDPEAAAQLSNDLCQMIRDVYRHDDTLTAEQITEALRGQTDEAVTPEAVQAVIEADATVTDAVTAVE